MDTPSVVNEFLQYVASKQAHNTMLAYRTGLRKFMQFIQRDPLTLGAVDAFASFLNGEVAHDTKAHYLIAVGLFYRWCVGKRLLALDTAEMEQLREFLKSATKRAEHLPRLPDDEAIAALCHAARSVEIKPSQNTDTTLRRDLERLRNIAIIEALRSSGMRVGEMVRLSLIDLDENNLTARVMGKGGKKRIVFFDDVAWRAIRDYVHARGGWVRTQPLFARHNSTTAHKIIPQAITTDTVRDVLHDLIARAGLKDAITPHWFRHWFATRVLEKTNDLAMVQDMLGHSSPATTRIYAKVSTKRMQAAHRKAFENSGV